MHSQPGKSMCACTAALTTLLTLLKGTAQGNKPHTHFRFCHPIVLSDNPVEMHAKTHLGHRFLCCWNWHQFPWGHGARHPVPADHITSVQREYGKLQDHGRNTRLSSPSALHFPSPFSFCRHIRSKIRTGQGNLSRAWNARWQPRLRNQKDTEARSPFATGLEYQANPTLLWFLTRSVLS